jgi:hypothetical protein
MEQWIIDRYNKKNKYFNMYAIAIDGMYCIRSRMKFHRVNKYNFLFNPKWGFAKAFWGEDKHIHAMYDSDQMKIHSGK